jgi:hypothetical protein
LTAQVQGHRPNKQNNQEKNNARMKMKKGGKIIIIIIIMSDYNEINNDFDFIKVSLKEKLLCLNICMCWKRMEISWTDNVKMKRRS